MPRSKLVKVSNETIDQAQENWDQLHVPYYPSFWNYVQGKRKGQRVSLRKLDDSLDTLDLDLHYQFPAKQASRIELMAGPNAYLVYKVWKVRRKK